MSTLTEQLRHARGKHYYDILKAILAEVGQQMHADAIAAKEARGGHFTVLDLATLAIRYDLNMKATCEWLEECHFFYTGTYELLKRDGLKPMEMLAKARAALVGPQGEE